MPKYKAVQSVPMDFLGEEWKGCYIKVNAPSPREVAVLAEKREDDEEMRDPALRLVKSIFVEAKAFNGEEQVVFKDAKELDEMPAAAIFAVDTHLAKGLSPKD